MSNPTHAKRQGTVYLSHHLAQASKPVAVAMGAAALAGCGEETGDYRMYTKVSTCATYEGSQRCENLYQRAEKEAQRTALRYFSERDCQQDFGPICIANGENWQPKTAGFISSQTDPSFAIPVFTSTGPNSSHLGYAFLADGEILTHFAEADGAWVDLPSYYQMGLPESGLEEGGGFIPGVATGYIVSEIIDETGDYLERRAKRRLQPSQLQTFATSPKVKTISRGGFGKTGSIKGAFGS